ncbi:MAG TPA: glycosyltransferase family 39 protein, partial [Vicinamibacterales bacterium]
TTRTTPALALLLAAGGLLLAAWSLVVPIFEAPDEPAHWQYARYLHDHASLPLYAPGFEEANSPPLYYLLIAPLARETASPSMVLVRNPDGPLHSLAPPRVFLNSDRDFGRYLPIRAARLLSAALSLLTVWICYRVGRAATGRHGTGLLTAMAVLLLPQFSFRGSHVSNDVLVTLFGAATTLGVVLLVERFTWSRALWTAVALAGAYLSKISAIALALPVAFALATGQGVPWRTRAIRLGALGLTLLLVLPWSIRNVVLYGDPFASGAMRTVVAHIINDRPLLSRYFVTEFPLLLYRSFFGAFGWANLPLPVWAYVFFGALTIAAVAGLVAGLRRRSIDRRLAATLVLTGLATLAVVVHINRSFTQPQGRYLFPALPAIALLAALGLEQIRIRQATLFTPVRLALLLGALNLFALLGIVWPAYYPALDRELPGGDRQIFPAQAHDLALTPERSLVATGKDTWLLAPVDLPAEQYRRVLLEIRGRATPAAQRGCLRFATLERELNDNPRTCFDWQADGTPRRIEVPLGAHAEWRGTITHILLRPFVSPEIDKSASTIEDLQLRLARGR